MAADHLQALRDNYRLRSEGDWTDASLFDRYAVAVLPDPSPRPHYGRDALADYMRRLLGVAPRMPAQLRQATAALSRLDSLVAVGRRASRSRTCVYSDSPTAARAA